MALDLESLEKLERRQAVEEARRTRLDALAAKGLRRRATRSRIVLGGAILAELRDNPDDRAFLDRIVSILDERVSRGRDRDDLRELLSVPIPTVAPALPADNGDDDLPDFDSLTAATLRVPRSLVASDPDYADVKGLIDKES
jgi:hypothetical protein